MTQIRETSSRYYGGQSSPAPDRLDRTLVDLEPLVGLEPTVDLRPRDGLAPGDIRRSLQGSWSRLAPRPRRMIALSGWTFVWFLIFAPHGGYSWHYFAQGGALLFDGSAPRSPAGGLHVYADYPQLQFGPLTFVTAELLRLTGSVLFAEAVMTAIGVVVIYCVERIAVRARPDLAWDKKLHVTMLVGGGVFLIGWADLAVAYGHLDDVMALLAVTLATWALVSESPAIAGICVGLAVDAKPWALVFLPLILAVPAVRRQRAAIAVAVTIILAWLPFVLVDPHTLTAAGYTIVNEPSSALRALGVSTPRTPGWDRPAQIVLGCLLGALAVTRGRWPAIIALGIGARIALDPGVYGYYTAGILLGALIWDILGPRRPIPVWTLISGLALAVTPLLTADAALQGQVRLWFVLAVTATLLLGPARRHPENPTA